nr:hypothetical protein Iba_chr03cCG5400 [Ipomoea batatas]
MIMWAAGTYQRPMGIQARIGGWLSNTAAPAGKSATSSLVPCFSGEGTVGGRPSSSSEASKRKPRSGWDSPECDDASASGSSKISRISSLNCMATGETKLNSSELAAESTSTRSDSPECGPSELTRSESDELTRGSALVSTRLGSGETESNSDSSRARLLHPSMRNKHRILFGDRETRIAYPLPGQKYSQKCVGWEMRKAGL